MTIEKIEPLDDPPGGWLEYYDDGTIRAKDSDGRLIKHPKNKLPPKTASEMGKRGAIKYKDFSEDVADLLDSLELAGPVYANLAEVLAKGGSAGVQAAKLLLQASKESTAVDAEVNRLAAGRIYYFDGSEFHEVIMTKKYLADLKELLQHARRNDPNIGMKNEYFELKTAR